MITLSIVSETNTTRTLGWAAVPGAVGFKFTVDGKVSHTWDGSRTTLKVAKTAKKVVVEALATTDRGEWPAVAPPPPPPPSGIAAPPVPPITTIRDEPNVAVNLYLPAQNGTVIQDYVIDNCGDQSVLLQPNVTGCTVRRVYISRPGQNPRDLQVSGALHALYLKSAGNVIEDFVADYSQNTGASLQTNALSVRKRNNVLRRTEVRGPVALAAAYFEEDTTKGVVTFDQGRWEFSGDTALWVDGAIQSFVLRGIHVNGPGLLARFKNHTGDFVRVEGCTVRGRPATEADVAGARGLTISPYEVAEPVGPLTKSAPVFLRTGADALTEKLEIASSPDYGIGNMVWPSQPSTGTWTLRDCIARNVSATPPRAMDGTGEAGFWIGQRTRASRLRASGCAWMGMWTGAACDGSVIEDFDLSGNPHVGLYVEHVTRNTVFRRFRIDHRGGDSNAVNVEWWYGGQGSHDLVFEDFDITVDAGKWAFFLDAGTYGVTIRNGIIRGAGNGIAHPKNLSDPSKPNQIDWASIQFLATGTRESVHANAIG